MSAEPQATNRRFGKYELLSLIARGGMGEVYLASLRGELGFEKKLVVKTIRPELAQNPKFVDLFAAEAKTAVALTHGNIVPIYELGRSDETLYIAMGHVDGPSVSQLLQQHATRRTPMDVGTALFVVREVLTGLAYAHTAEPNRPPVVHRDISPRNILVDRSGQVRIVDFGIALAAEVQVAVSAGSTGYMAPEQARAAAAAPSADVFSVGCVLYELITGVKAFAREGVWVSPKLDAAPARLRPLIARALSLDPSDRPTDAAVLLRELSPLLAELAPNYTTQDLADHLREFFPDGWSSPLASEPISGTPATPACAHTETFATRLTAVKDIVPAELQAPTAPPAPSEVVATTQARRRASWRWPAAGLAIVAGLGLFVTVQRGAPTGAADRADLPKPGHARDWAADSGTSPRADPTPRPTPEPPTAAQFLLEVAPADVVARVTADGESVEGPPFVLTPPDAGTTEIQIAAPGFATFTFELMPDDRGRHGTQVELPPLREGKLDVFAPTVSYAYIYVDGKKIKNKNTPLHDHPVVEGKHTVKVVCPAEVCGTQRKLTEKRVTIEARQKTTVEASG